MGFLAALAPAAWAEETTHFYYAEGGVNVEVAGTDVATVTFTSEITHYENGPANRYYTDTTVPIQILDLTPMKAGVGFFVHCLEGEEPPGMEAICNVLVPIVP